MDFRVIRNALVALGYTTQKANAKIAHDVVLNAIKAAGFHDNVTVKGGVVMSGLTDAVRRATMDMDVDFLGYSIENASIGRFIRKLNRYAGCEVKIAGAIQELRQQEYRGKRIHLVLTDDNGVSVKTKVDIGVQANPDIRQVDFAFKVVTTSRAVKLLVNTREQIFVEKLKSLLRIGIVSTRYKDIYDMYYLCSRLRKRVLRQYLRTYVFEDKKMFENDTGDVVKRLERVFTNRTFIRRMANPNYAWLDVSPEVVTEAITSFLSSLGNHQ